MGWLGESDISDYKRKKGVGIGERDREIIGNEWFSIGVYSGPCKYCHLK